MKLTEPIIVVIKNAAQKLTGPRRRKFMAETTLELLDGSPTKAERTFGWGRETVKKGLRELATGIVCLDNYRGRGNKKTEEKMPNIEIDIRDIVKSHSQTAPDSKGPLTYISLTAKSIRHTLIDEKSYADEDLPAERTFIDILKRLGYRLKRVDNKKK